MNRFSMLAVVCLLFVFGCGGSEVNCDGCLTEQSAELSGDGCYPYCEGEEEEPPLTKQTAPHGRYLGAWTLVAVDGPNTAACLAATPIGFQLAHRIKVVDGVTVTERDQPCTTTSTNPSDFGFWCVNYNYSSACSTDPASPYYRPENPTCTNYWERIEESLQFSADAMHVVGGGVVQTRNWGDCTTYRWTARYDWILPD